MPTFAGAKDARQFIHRDVLNSESDLERQQFSSSHSNPALSLQRAQRDPSRLQPYDVLNLQRTIGNQATLQLLRRKSTPQIAPIGDGPRSTLQATPLQSSGSVPPIQRWFGKKKPKVNTETEEQPPQEDLDPDPMTTHGIRPDYRDPQLANQPATRYTLTIAAKRDSKYYLRFQKARLEATIRNEVHKRLNKTTGSKLRVKSTEELKMSAAKKVARRPARLTEA
jgi:hypothetical protein